MTPLLSPLAALGSAAALGIADFNGGLAGRRTPAPSVTVGIELSFYPAFTVLCARLFTRERLTAIQAVGAAIRSLRVATIAGS